MAFTVCTDEKFEPDTEGASRLAPGSAAMSKGCKAYAVDLSAYFDGELQGEERERIEAHLAACPGCQNTLERLGKLRNALHAMAKPSRRRRSILDDIKARLEEEPDEESSEDNSLPC